MPAEIVVRGAAIDVADAVTVAVTRSVAIAHYVTRVVAVALLDRGGAQAVLLAPFLFAQRVALLELGSAVDLASVTLFPLATTARKEESSDE